MSDEIYRDKFIVLDGDGVTILRYYFPMATPKRIAYSDIRRVLVEDMNWLTGKGRFWGAAIPNTWMPMDWGRMSKDKVIVLDVGARVKPCVTPDDPDRVAALIKERVPAGA
ncbi:hypothetical protein ACTXG7_09410 [Mycolicibacterium sp. Dal123E01]|uniref:hypothetical protein n=1 Tax=Mycolicibacterium sp. Dal123E01 TaxID=3457578 RepID=UPI00403E6560